MSRFPSWVPRVQVSKIPRFHGSQVSRFHGSMVPKFQGLMVPWFPVFNWYHGSMVPRFQGFMVLWFQISNVLWLPGSTSKVLRFHGSRITVPCRGLDLDGWKKTGFRTNLGVRLLLKRICGVPHNFLGEIEPGGTENIPA